MIKCILSFILGGIIGIILMSCVVIGKESDRQSEKDIRKTKND